MPTLNPTVPTPFLLLVSTSNGMFPWTNLTAEANFDLNSVAQGKNGQDQLEFTLKVMHRHAELLLAITSHLSVEWVGKESPS